MPRTIKISTLYKASFVMTALLLFAVTLPAEEKKDPWWWQEEIGPPPEGQIINPDYIDKRDELERFWSQTSRDRGLTRQYWQWTNRVNVKSNSTQRAAVTAARLERELSEIPVYVPAETTDAGSEPAVPAQP